MLIKIIIFYPLMTFWSFSAKVPEFSMEIRHESQKLKSMSMSNFQSQTNYSNLIFANLYRKFILQALYSTIKATQNEY